MPPSLCIEIDGKERQLLLELARQSIAAGLSTGRALDPDLATLEPNLRQLAAVFVSLTRNGRLRGCVGSLQPVDPMALAVTRAAYNAAFQDHRFAALTANEIEGLRLEISLLSALQPLAAASKQELLAHLKPGEDGLLMQDQGHRATFLPKVWDQISAPEKFLEQLMIKAGLPARHWSTSIRFHRYHTLSFAES